MQKRCPKCGRWNEVYSNADTFKCAFCFNTFHIRKNRISPKCSRISQIKDKEQSIFSNWYSFKGRARRLEYWVWTSIAIIMVAFGVLTCISTLFVLGQRADEVNLSIDNIFSSFFWFFLFLILGIYIATAVTVRRLHDRGLSGWWYLLNILLGFIPYIGSICAAIFFIIVGLLDSQPFANEYGENPKGVDDGGSGKDMYSEETAESRLLKLNSLRNKGIISESEYIEKREKIISDI